MLPCTERAEKRGREAPDKEMGEQNVYKDDEGIIDSRVATKPSEHERRRTDGDVLGLDGHGGPERVRDVAKRADMREKS